VAPRYRPDLAAVDLEPAPRPPADSHASEPWPDLLIDLLGDFGYYRIDGNQAWLENVHISPYAQGGYANHEPLRPRKLLLHAEEIASLTGKVRQRGYTLIPLRMYFAGNHAKVEVGLCRGKRQYDKREAMAERDARRQMERALRR